MANLPIVEKNRLQTGTGVAEVEFEDNSTLRLAPDSAVEFPKLERLPGGTTASSVLVLKGMAYVSLMKTAGNEFDLLFGQQMLRLPPASHIRLQLGDTQAKVAVLDGTVHVNGPGGGADVPKKKTVTLPLEDQAQPEVTKDVASNPLDSWDKDSVGYHQRSAIASNYGNSGYSYGLSDMMYYGSFMNAGGCGSMWRPYFASADWDPYSNGAWAYYGGAGYSWVSPYPWGWTPYHYGSWAFCPGAGWGWQPGGLWNGLNNTALLTPRGGSGGGPVRVPIVPSHPPAAGQPTLRAVNLKPPVRSGRGFGKLLCLPQGFRRSGSPPRQPGQTGQVLPTRHTAGHGEHEYLRERSSRGSRKCASDELARCPHVDAPWLSAVIRRGSVLQSRIFRWRRRGWQRRPVGFHSKRSSPQHGQPQPLDTGPAGFVRKDLESGIWPAPA